jgi:GH15 family glucan-1,4-alpha-glucosidase
MEINIKSTPETNSGVNNRRGFLSGTIFGAVLGIGSTLVYQYLNGILKQPRLSSKVILSEVDDFDTQETRALFIAVESLHSGIEERRLENEQRKLILHAGYRNFRESWARDFAFAVYGLLDLKEHQPVKDTLEAFFWYQRPNGQFPVKLRSLNVVSRFFHSLLEREQPLEAQLRPKYITGHRSASLDGQALLITAASMYIQQSEDHDFSLDHWEKLQSGLRWLRSHTQKNTELLTQSAFADWADSAARKGVVFYTNIVYWKALKEMANLADQLGYKQEADLYLQIADALDKDIQTYLWRPELGYFATSTSMDNLSSAANLLAIAWEFATRDQSHSILDRIQGAGMAHPVPTQAAHPPYKRADISIENRLGGIANYHTEGAWVWIGAWHIIALCKTERIEEAHDLLSRIADVIVRDQQVHEVYGTDGKPLSSLFYSSEAPLTWSAGMMIHAYNILESCI